MWNVLKKQFKHKNPLLQFQKMNLQIESGFPSEVGKEFFFLQITFVIKKQRKKTKRLLCGSS
jgi:hypothetical protein